MTPVDQEFLHDPENGIHGDCMRACVASILNLPISEVPHFGEGDALHNAEIYWNNLANYLATKGLFHLELNSFDLEISKCPTDIYHLIYGKTIRGTEHATVGRNGELIHVPHPSKAGLVGNKEDWTFGFLIPIFNTNEPQ